MAPDAFSQDMISFSSHFGLTHKALLDIVSHTSAASDSTAVSLIKVETTRLREGHSIARRRHPMGLKIRFGRPENNVVSYKRRL
jgi:hypothetical protein